MVESFLFPLGKDVGVIRCVIDKNPNNERDKHSVLLLAPLPT